MHDAVAVAAIAHFYTRWLYYRRSSTTILSVASASRAHAGFRLCPFVWSCVDDAVFAVVSIGHGRSNPTVRGILRRAAEAQRSLRLRALPTRGPRLVRATTRARLLAASFVLVQSTH